MAVFGCILSSRPVSLTVSKRGGKRTEEKKEGQEERRTGREGRWREIDK